MSSKYRCGSGECPTQSFDQLGWPETELVIEQVLEGVTVSEPEFRRRAMLARAPDFSLERARVWRASNATKTSLSFFLCPFVFFVAVILRGFLTANRPGRAARDRALRLGSRLRGKD